MLSHSCLRWNSGPLLIMSWCKGEEGEKKNKSGARSEKIISSEISHAVLTLEKRWEAAHLGMFGETIRSKISQRELCQLGNKYCAPFFPCATEILLSQGLRLPEPGQQYWGEILLSHKVVQSHWQRSSEGPGWKTGHVEGRAVPISKAMQWKTVGQ